MVRRAKANRKDAALGATCTALNSALRRSCSVMYLPDRGRKPWLAMLPSTQPWTSSCGYQW